MRTNRCNTAQTMVLSALLVMASAISALSAVVYVSPNGNDASDGGSWAHAKRTIAAGVQSANPNREEAESPGALRPGDDIWVASGVYTECVTLKPGVSIYGGFSGMETTREERSWVQNETIINGGGYGPVITIPAGAERDTVVSGLTIRNGSSESGGGIMIDSASPSIINNRIVSNTATTGGGIYCVGGSPAIAGNILVQNSATKGAGIYCVQSQAVISNNTISTNTASELAGGIGGSGCTGKLANNIIAFNSSGIEFTASQILLSHNCVYGNQNSSYSGTSAGASDFSIDPAFVNPSTGDFRLATASSCIDAGDNNLVEPTCWDMDMCARLSGQLVDVGAYEIQVFRSQSRRSQHSGQGGYQLLSGGGGGSNVIYVKYDASSSTHDGSSWDTAYLTVQDGLNAAVSGNEVWVARGTYRQLLTMKVGVVLYGGFAGTESSLDQRPTFPRTSPDSSETILSGKDSGGQYLNGSVIYCPNGMDSSTVIDGFTISDGNGHLSGGYRSGGGIYCGLSSLTISNNRIVNNTVEKYGAGIYSDTGSPVITNNLIDGNCSLASGGGVRLYSSQSVIHGNTITNNTAAMNTGGGGGGILILGGSPVISNNTIAGNQAPYGGGIYANLGWSGVIKDNQFTGNSAQTSTAGVYIYSSCAGRISNNTFADNSSRAVYIYTLSTTTVSNNIIVYNVGGIASFGSPTLSHNCVYANTGFNYSGISPGTGDISVDPLFIDRTSGNYHIGSTSPCKDAGDDSAVLTGDMDIDDQVRINGTYVDIGADEIYLPAATPTFSPVAGSYSATQTVTISTATQNADIYYTTDGSTPTTDSNHYTSAVTIDHTLTLKAIAVEIHHTDSEVGSADYTIDTEAPAPGTASSPSYVSAMPISVTYSGASDSGGSGLKNVELWYKQGITGVWTDSGLRSTGASGSFSFTATSFAIYYFDLVAEDNVGNKSAAPSGSSLGDCSTIYGSSQSTCSFVSILIPWP